MKIWKWELSVADLQIIMMPIGAQVLSVQVHRGAPQLWAMVDETSPAEPRTFATVGTGHTMTKNAIYGRFIGTYQLHGGDLVFHVFEHS
jgi:hypothetical protein